MTDTPDYAELAEAVNRFTTTMQAAMTAAAQALQPVAEIVIADFRRVQEQARAFGLIDDHGNPTTRPVDTSSWLTVRDVQNRVSSLAATAINTFDFEDDVCRSVEAGIHHDVMCAIAAGAPHAALLAQAALETRAVPFQRW